MDHEACQRCRGVGVSIPGMVASTGIGHIAAGVVLGNGALVHESAYVDAGAVIGAGTRVWHFCHVLGGATIGARCSLGQNVVVMTGVRIGNNVRIQNNVSVYEGVELDDDVFCGPSMVFTNVFNPRSAVSRKSEYRKTLVKRGASVSAYDAEAVVPAKKALADLGDAVSFASNPYEACEDADALIIVTEWNSFRDPDWNLLRENLKAPVIFDGRNIYGLEIVQQHGFTYYSIGRPVVRAV